MERAKMMRIQKTRYIPKDSVPITREGINGIVYASELSAIAYRGKATKPDWYYSFRTRAQRDETIARFFEKVKANQEYQEKKREERKKFQTTLKPGDILHTHWGYEQTNVEFFQVLTVKNNTVTVQQIAATTSETGYMCGEKSPRKDAFLKDEPVLTRRVSPGNLVKIDDVRYAWMTESGKEKFYVSWYA
jgi:hypothetical protein